MPPLSNHLTIVDDQLIGKLETDDDLRARYLFLTPHQEFVGFWRVDGFDRDLYFNLSDEIGPYRVVAPGGLDRFLRLAEECEYNVAFFDDPGEILRPYEALNECPTVSLHSDLPKTVEGMLPYQVQGFNFLKDLRAGVAMWSTGTGKTVLASSLLKHHVDHRSFDLAWIVVKSHNKINVQRLLRRLTGLDAVVISGEKKVREALYGHLADVDEPRIVITNYEKFRVDHELILPLFEDRDVMCIWDEMPTKLKTRTTQIYQAVCQCLYTTQPPQVRADKIRPKSLRQYMLSATPIENDPEDWFNCVRLLDPSVYGTVKTFRNEYVSRYNFFDRNKPEVWHKLDKMGLKAAHVVHQVDKTDPDIAEQFPEAIDIPYYVDWDDQDRKIYDRFAKELVKESDEINMLSAIGVMQMLCDAPTMVNNSAARREAFEEAYAAILEGEDTDLPPMEGSAAALYLIDALGAKLTDERHTKLEALRQLLCEDHADEKVVVFSAFNDGLMPILEDHLKRWGVTYARYTGTELQRQDVQDAFRDDPDIQVFLSSDKGSDSIDLEQASVVINYDLPWKWSTLIQRQNRIHRITSSFQTVRYYTLMMADSVEDRKMKIVQQKFEYHQGVFKGAIADQAASAKMTRADLMYILTG